MTAVGVDNGGIVIRPYESGDRSSLRTVFCSTAFRYTGARALFEDEELLADFFTRYYTDFEPESCLVAERDGVFAGYLTGSLDTRRFTRVMARRIIPPLAVRFTGRFLTGRYKEKQSRRFLAWLACHSWKESPSSDMDLYPVHYHCNLNSAGQHCSLYSRMVLQFLDMARERGQVRMHGRVTGQSGSDKFGRVFQMYSRRRPDFLEYGRQRPCTMFQRVLGIDEPMANFVYGCKISEFQIFLKWLQKRSRM